MMNESSFFELNLGRGKLFLLPQFHQEEWDDWKIGKGQNIPEGQLLFIVNPCSGKKFWDVVQTGQGLLFAFSERVVKLLQDNEVTGCKFYPMKIKDHEDKKYYLLTVTGRCGALDDSKSKVIMTREYPETKIQNSNIVIPQGQFSLMKGRYFPLDSWDGSDFFMPEGTLFTYVTERVMSLLKKHKVTNVFMQNLTEVEWIPSK